MVGLAGLELGPACILMLIAFLLATSSSSVSIFNQHECVSASSSASTSPIQSLRLSCSSSWPASSWWSSCCSSPRPKWAAKLNPKLVTVCSPHSPLWRREHSRVPLATTATTTTATTFVQPKLAFNRSGANLQGRLHRAHIVDYGEPSERPKCTAGLRTDKPNKSGTSGEKAAKLNEHKQTLRKWLIRIGRQTEGARYFGQLAWRASAGQRLIAEQPAS